MPKIVSLCLSVSIVAMSASCVFEEPIVVVTPPGTPPVEPPVEPPELPPFVGQNSIVVGAALDPLASTLSASPSGGIVADGSESAEVVVRLVDTNGEVLVGVEIDIVTTPASIVTYTNGTRSDEFGRLFATLASTTPGEVVIEAATATGTLNDSARVTFDDCLSTAKRFERDVLGPVMSNCIGCHNTYGIAVEQGILAMPYPGDTNFNADLKTWIDLRSSPVSVGDESIPYVLAKPLGEIPHGGGTLFSNDSQEYQMFIRYLNELDAPQECPNEVEVDLNDYITMQSTPDLYKRTRLFLLGNTPALNEGADFDENAFDEALDDMLDDERMRDRFTDFMNDEFLTETSNVGQRATNRLAPQDFPQRWYFRPCADDGINPPNCCAAGECCVDDAANDPEFCALGKLYANESVARNTIELTRHVFENNLPFTEILTTSSVAVNPYSAKIFGLSGLNFDDDLTNDRHEYIMANLVPSDENELTQEHPSAGVLTSQTFLDRYPTTPTNIHRHRARTVYQKFLDVDVMTYITLEIQAEDEAPAGEGYDPFTDNVTCRACHASLDPVANAFNNWRNNERYQPARPIAEIRLPGFKGAETPATELPHALSWLGNEIVQDERFALAMVKLVHRFVTSHDPLALPINPNLDNYEAHRIAYRHQAEYFEAQKNLFISNNYSMKEAIKNAIKGSYFRASKEIASTSDDPIVLEALRLSGFGIAKTMTPEQLTRRLRDLTGMYWSSNRRGVGFDNLLHPALYPLLMGGIDSDEVNKRARDPFPIFTNVSRRLANDFGCNFVAQEFSHDEPRERRMFGLATRAGDESEANIRATARTILERFWNQAVDDAEVDAAVGLYNDVKNSGLARIIESEESESLIAQCRATRDFESDAVLNTLEGRSTISTDPSYAIRAWSAVVTYALTDYNFLYE